MIDDVSTSGSRWRERAIAATRERLKRLEIEAHRIKAELARLEFENEHEIADELSDELGRNGMEVAWPAAIVARPQCDIAPRPNEFGSIQRPAANKPVSAAIVRPEVVIPSKEIGSKIGEPSRKIRRKTSSAWILSMAAHAAVLALLAPMTFALFAHDEMPLLARFSALDSPFIEEPVATPIELVSFEEFELPGDVASEVASLAESAIEEPVPLEPKWASEPTATLGQLHPLPTDAGTLMVGSGRSLGNARAGGGGRGAAGDAARLGMTNFFGTPAQGNCVVFLVDNSGSMKQGRMETTLFELARSIERMTDKQRFYVVFYSDQAYPMLYPESVMEPLAATQANKQRLYQWLQTVELCSGGALVKAMELAESLRPEVVYILSDGDIAGSRTMQRLAEPNDRKFAIHTLGMGVKKPQDAQNLVAIAQANRGTFQMVRPLAAAVQMAKARPIRSNPYGVSWGESTLQPIR